MNTSYYMHSFLGIAHEGRNAWLGSLDIDSLNHKLEHRRACHRALLGSGAFWELSDAEKAEVSPEVRKIEWLDLSTAVRYAFQSMNQHFTPVNAFQKEQFEKHNIANRDPMYVTMAQLLQLENFDSVESLVAFTESFALDEERGRARWLEDGLTPDQVDAIFRKRLQDRNAENKL
jgi:hypothetical protein